MSLACSLLTRTRIDRCRTTPIAIAVGLGLRTTYNGGSYTAQVVSGVLDSISAGILLYTGRSIT